MPITHLRPPRLGGINDAITTLLNDKLKNNVDIFKIDKLNLVAAV
jgi:hypothetical protein